MKKKGFTLVELLAVIAILAILVIVAMPNVLGMFSSAKTNTFVTEVQKYMDTAKTAFVQAALNSPAKTLVFTDQTGVNLEGLSAVNAGQLDMDGSKHYYIVMNRHGEFTRVMIWDNNLCFNNHKDGLQKGDVEASMVVDSASDTPASGCTYSIPGGGTATKME